MHPSSIAKRGFVLVFLAFILVYSYGLGQLPLLGPDEPRYAQIAREMFLRNDLITPTLGGHLWFEKPALLYWMMIASFKLFGVSEAAARLGSAVSGLLTILAVFWTARRVEQADESGESSGLSFWSALAAGTTLGLLVFARAASFDIVVTMTTTWALAFFVAAEIEDDAKRRWRWLVGFYVFVGVSLLAKGLVGIVIPFGVAGFYYLLRRRVPDRTTIASLLWGLPLAAVVAAVWYGPVISRHGWPFIDQFFIQHHFARYATAKYHHPAPVYFYLLIFIALGLPWTAFAIDGLLKTGKKLWRREEGSGLDPRRTLQVFAFAWIWFPLLFFSFSGSKLPGYILPIVPAAALIAGDRLVRFKLSRWPIRVTAAICLLFAIAAVFYSQRPEGFSAACAALVATPLVVVGIFGLIKTERGDTFAMLISGATLIAIVVILNCGAAKPAERESSKQLLKLADERGHSQAIIFGMQRDDRSPEFYAAGRVVYDATGEPVMYEGPGQIVWESRQRNAKILAFVPPEDVKQFLELSSMRSELIGDNGKFALVAVWPP